MRALRPNRTHERAPRPQPRRSRPARTRPTRMGSRHGPPQTQSPCRLRHLPRPHPCETTQHAHGIDHWRAGCGETRTSGSAGGRAEKDPPRAPRCAAHPTQATKTGLGLDQHQHRRWKAWHRWTTLVIAAHAFLAAATATSSTSPDCLIAITVNELRRLFYALNIEPARRVADVIAWSIYRRRHQHQAKTSHYARQALTEP